MAYQPEPIEHGAMPALQEIAADSIDELKARVDFSGLSEPDQVAIMTAIIRAAFRGILRGLSFAPSPENVHVQGMEELPDPWLERYREDP